MSEIKDGGPAFGQVVELRCVRVEMDGSAEYEPEAMVPGGLSVRDYFAAKAIQGTLPGSMLDTDEYARLAYRMADAMLRARAA